MFQILLERGRIELSEKLGLSGRIVATDIVDHLTFCHSVFRLGRRAELSLLQRF